MSRAVHFVSTCKRYFRESRRTPVGLRDIYILEPVDDVASSVREEPANDAKGQARRRRRKAPEPECEVEIEGHIVCGHDEHNKARSRRRWRLQRGDRDRNEQASWWKGASGWCRVGSHCLVGRSEWHRSDVSGASGGTETADAIRCRTSVT